MSSVDSLIPIITAFRDSPDRGRGMARDMRVRWAFEEVGQKYGVRLMTFAEMKEESYRTLQPFQQIPAYQEGDLVLFESGAIVLRIAEGHPGVLLPLAAEARARIISWMFCALNTIEPPIVEREAFALLESDKPWFNDRLPLMNERVQKRLQQLSSHLGDSEWLEGMFSAGDLMMVTVLRRVLRSGLLTGYPNLEAYIARAEARPAYQRAFAAQRAVYEASQNK